MLFKLLKRVSPLSLILIAFVVLALVYAWATPPLEASDELWHVGMVQHIAETGRLPVQVIGQETIYEQEGSQPPLYYLLSAAMVSGIDRGDFDTVRQPNPHAVAGVPGNVGNKNLVLHDSPHPPLEQTALAVYILRLFSIALGCVSVAAVYMAAREAAPERPALALLAAGLTAFNPMFLFITASVNNDNLVTALNSMVILLTVRLVTQGFTARRCVFIALLVALATLSKLSGLVLIPVVAVAALWRRLIVDGNGRSWGEQLRWPLALGGLMLLAWVGVAGWWYLRNGALYGELFGTATMAAVAGVRTEPFTLQTLINEFQGFRFGYWGVFGAFNIMTFRPFYDVMDAITLAGLFGLLLLGLKWWPSQRYDPPVISFFLFGLTVLIGSVSVIAWTAQTYASQGRLLFPFVAAGSPLLAAGLLVLPETIFRRSGQRMATVLCEAMAGFALVVPVASIAPEYAPPTALEQLPESAQAVYARLGDVALVGYETPDGRYAPGDIVPITVYWQVLEQSTSDLSLYLHATLADGTVIGKVDSYPGAGRQRTTTWKAGAIYADSYGIPLEADTNNASRLRVRVGWWDYPTETGIEPLDADGNPLETVMLNAGGFASSDSVSIPEDMTTVDGIRFGGTISLRGYQLDGDRLLLLWESGGSLAADYTVFVQVLDDQNGVIGQGDAPPMLPTHYWQSGDSFVTTHTLVYSQLPAPGSYRLMIGWYNPVDLTRLDTDAPDDAYLLTMIEVTDT